MTNRQRLNTAEYEIAAMRTDRRAGGGSEALPLLGLFGETGSLLSEVKKKQRDSLSYVGYADAVVEELGDVLWYITSYASHVGLSLTGIASRVLNGDATARPSEAAVLFAALQHPKLSLLDDRPTPAFERTLLELASAVGRLMPDHLEPAQPTGKAECEDRLVDVFRLLIVAADEAGVSLETAAIRNIEKTRDRWPDERIFPPLFDADDDEYEQLPRLLHIDIFERVVAGKTFVFQRCYGVTIGDRLTDNSLTADDYRFHDVFHYAYAAVLGWSPVVRALLRVKRKSKPDVDDAEDGARAALSEEGIAAWIFAEANRPKHFEGLRAGELPFGLLKQVRQFVRHYDAGKSPLWLWEEAILQGFAAFRYLKQHRRARVVMDLRDRALKVEPLPE